MADTKTSALSSATALTGAEQLPGVQSAASVKITGTQVADLAASRFHPGLISTNWYGPATASGAFNSGASVDFLYAIPIIVPFACTITDLGVYVGTGAGNAKFGLYNTVAGVPSALLGFTTTSGTSVASNTTFSSAALTVAAAVSAGLYWGAVLFSGTPSVGSSATDSLLAYLIGGDTGAHVVATGGPTVTGYTGTGTYSGGMNSTFTSPSRRYGAMPNIAFKVQ